MTTDPVIQGSPACVRLAQRKQSGAAELVDTFLAGGDDGGRAVKAGHGDGYGCGYCGEGGEQGRGGSGR